MWSYSAVKIALTKAYAACACGENLATPSRGPRSTPTVTRTTRSSLLSPVTAKATWSCSAASAANAAKHLRVAPRRGRSCTWITTDPGSPSTAACPVNALRCIVIAPCYSLEGNLPHACPTEGTSPAVPYAVVRGDLRQVLPVSTSRRGNARTRRQVVPKRPETSRADLSGRGLLRRLGRVPDGRSDRAGG